ncbi:LuxR C-terminal-related transcriptional regulator [Sinimarinibacterium sp. NLF-5-8]|uniref:LuxR C-terminal-related transcriptional regulator n=1 Tax=Sinimarinibacterium sp. NLF-5-8 TaxID=2698684 RepID=UPI00137BD2A6|nr:LuxR C-terminal-related transcriptional regulator [Sinimarinibacterium sp. NLF-5-8]QHS09281.1 AAA family ATPase [Sinimarinibacterium sp. NLF-5-8]
MNRYDPVITPVKRAHILRTRALAQIESSADTALVLIRAPAGFGKTTLLKQYSQARRTQGDRVIWVRMDAQSSDITQFLRILCDAIDGLDETQRQRRARQDLRPTTVQTLIRALQRIHGRGLVVIDNFEQAFTAPFNQTLTQIAQNLPPNMQLCIATRVLPATTLSGLQLREQAIVLDETDLRFTPQESAEFFREFVSLSAEDIRAIHVNTGGWPAALQCIRLCLQRDPAHRHLVWSGNGVTRDLINFLATEVFDHLPLDLRATLVDLCLPEKLNAGLVEHLTGMDDGLAVLQRIEQAGLFLAQTDMEGNWYRFHNLFRQFLLARVHQNNSPAELRQRHLCIAHWFAQHHYQEDAIQHALKADDQPLALTLLESVIDHMLAQERLTLIEQYVDALPTDMLLRHENVIAAATIAYGFLRAFDKANRLLGVWSEHLASSPDPRALAVRDFAALFVLAAQDRIEELGEHAAQASEKLTEQDGLRYAVTFNARAVFLCAKARFEEARALLLRARPLHDRDHFLFGQAYQDAIYGMSLFAEARLEDAACHLATALRRTEEQACGHVSAGSITAMYLADAYYEQNRIAEAQSLLSDYGSMAERQVIVDALATLYICRARIAFNRGDIAAADAILERALVTAYQHGFTRLLAYAQAERIRQATLSDDLELAEQRLRSYDLGALAADAEMMFHAGETEAHTVTWARLMLRRGQPTQARIELQGALRVARQQRRRRRELKLLVMLALAQHAEGHFNLARRSLIEALEIGQHSGITRSFIDERAPLIQLLQDVRSHFAGLPDLAGHESLLVYVDHLLTEAGAPMTALPASSTASAAIRLIEPLTEKEQRLLAHVANGLSNKGIATRLSVSTNTVKWHLRNIFEKLQTHNRMQAVAVARQHRLID